MEEEKLVPCWYQWGVKAGDLNRGGDFTPEEEMQTFHLRVAGGGEGWARQRRKVGRARSSRGIGKRRLLKSDTYVHVLEMFSFRMYETELLNPQHFGEMGLQGPALGLGGLPVSGVVPSDCRALKQVLASALTVALSGRCDRDVLRLLLVLPEDEASWFAVRELCGLPGTQAYALIMSMSRNLDLRNLIYKVRGDCCTWRVRCLQGLPWVGR